MITIKIELPNTLPEINFKDLGLVRKHLNLTLRQVEKQTGISNAYLSQLENGKSSPSYDKVKTLINFYNKKIKS